MSRHDDLGGQLMTISRLLLQLDESQTVAVATWALDLLPDDLALRVALSHLRRHDLADVAYETLEQELGR